MVVDRISDVGTTTTLRLTAEAVKNLSAASGVAYRRFGAILTSLVAPNPAPKGLGNSCSRLELHPSLARRTAEAEPDNAAIRRRDRRSES